ncbi:sensor histidine kinase [Aridibaculum aurantiacum]|uniref:sensor histidine kinase n=1 Tax=Aridibaculum aurantiacum TaxID=2810307 RepID=UPI001A970016|nr:HAMP domain-containing sensor histidine kinase [Aridibaculum aurantiacum]
MKIQFKIALLFTLLCTGIIIGLSCAIYFFANERAFQDFYTRLELRATIAAKANFEGSQATTQAYEQVRNEHLERLPEELEYIVPMDSLLQVSDTFALTVPTSFYHDLIDKGSASHRDRYHFFRGVRYNYANRIYAVIISAEHTYARNFLLNLRNILITVNLISTLVIFTVGYIFGRKILEPIRRIMEDVNNINATSLHKRLEIKEGKDEITELANTFNSLLSRLETSFETQNNFVSNASHELNTPLTAIIGEAELALAKPRDTQEYRQAMDVILKQAEKLRNITKSLLELAQSGFTGNLSSEDVEVAELMENVQHVALGIYPTCNLEIDNSLHPANLHSLMVRGNFRLLELCLSNILLNACKYSNGKTVTVAIASTDEHLVFIIKDKGIGIPTQDMPHIFDPFFRASNVSTSKGYGIGLPLARNIINLHNGTIHIASKELEGTEVVVKIPLSKKN